MTFALPRRAPGRPTAKAQAKYEQQVEDFCAGILELRSGLEFQVGSRGWGYVCESHGLINKDDIDLGQTLINDCRKFGALPLDICLVDEGRAFDNLERIDDTTPEEEAERIVGYVHEAHENYWPTSFWDNQKFYVQALVEKSTLKSLFAPVCEEFHVPIATASGWSDINMRADMMRRFAKREADGKQPVLLYGGDHDPGGLQIWNFLRSNMAELENAVGWSPENLIIDRFGLNFDFIEKNKLTWIDNLITGSKGKCKGVCLSNPNHDDHYKPYVQNYLRQFGARKVEGEALVKVPAAGRELCLQAILKYVPAGAPTAYEEFLVAVREKVRLVVLRLLAEGEI